MNNYHNWVNKLRNTEKNSKLHCSVLKFFPNNKTIPIIPPLLDENSLITDFEKKAIFFHYFF